jgi:hypothetical protein
MSMRGLIALGACLAALATSPADGQAAATQATTGKAGVQPGAGRVAGAMQGGRVAPGRRGGPAALVAQQRRIEQAVANVVRNQLSLNDDQMVKVREIDSRFGRRRLELDREEIRIRNLLTTAMANPGRGGNDARITMLLDSLRLGLLQGRLDVERGEQRELGTFLTPRQVAQFFFIRERVRQKIAAEAVVVPTVPDSGARGRRGGG